MSSLNTQISFCFFPEDSRLENEDAVHSRGKKENLMKCYGSAEVGGVLKSILEKSFMELVAFELDLGKFGVFSLREVGERQNQSEERNQGAKNI